MKRNQKAEVIKKEKFLRTPFPVLLPKNERQSRALEAFKYSTILVLSGWAGTGKTLLSCWHAAKRLKHGDIKKIVLIRAYQPLAGRTIGFMPGDATEKLMPFYQQMIDYLEDYLGVGAVEIALKNKTIELCSLETIRGRSWDDAIIIVDESQSLFIPEVQALSTRLGSNAQMIFCGDDTGQQTDVKNVMNGLRYFTEIINKYEIPDVEQIVFLQEDIVREGLTKEFVVAYEKERLADAKGTSIISQVDINKQFKTGR